MSLQDQGTAARSTRQRGKQGTGTPQFGIRRWRPAEGFWSPNLVGRCEALVLGGHGGTVWNSQGLEGNFTGRLQAMEGLWSHKAVLLSVHGSDTNFRKVATCLGRQSFGWRRPGPHSCNSPALQERQFLT